MQAHTSIRRGARGSQLKEEKAWLAAYAYGSNAGSGSRRWLSARTGARGLDFECVDQIHFDVVLHCPHERFLLHPTGRTSPTENHLTAAVSDRLLLGSACTASHRPSLPRLCSVGRRISSIDTGSYLSFLEGNRGLTLKFTVPRQVHSGIAPFTRVDLLSVDSIEGHNQVSDKRFPTTGPRIEAGNVVIHRGLHVSNMTASCSLCAIGCKELFTDRHRCPDVRYVVVFCLDIDHGVWSWKDDGSVWTEGLIRASFGIARLICASFGIPRLICASFGITRLIRASFGITRLMCKRTARGRPTRGRKDTEMPPRRGARRGGGGGRGREAGLVQPEVQSVAQATDTTAPVTHVDLAAVEQRFRDLIMQMREQQQQPAALAPAPAPAPVPVVPQVVPDQLSAEAKHLRDFRKYNPTTLDGSLEDPTRAQLWLSSLETIFRYMKCLEDQKVQCAVFMLTDRGTAWWETTERMLGGDVGQITWQQFKESFYAKFFSASLRDAKR
ncbi:gag protease polyprotein [Cucumis melo var. makuwa]|uniref:Gag protease polyprotein n=1 Tax=Cucumis melo var. makuwa TaxID=1194695 RepID=A0A5A7TU07_CUCMM|nr:gag protease polyprotein [Cucumis melo var. makuwa]